MIESRLPRSNSELEDTRTQNMLRVAWRATNTGYPEGKSFPAPLAPTQAAAT
jgi:hypothetical protein